MSMKITGVSLEIKDFLLVVEYEVTDEYMTKQKLIIVIEWVTSSGLPALLGSVLFHDESLHNVGKTR